MVKLNEDELPVLTELLGLPEGLPAVQLAQLRARFGLDAVVYTRAERGTMLVLPDEVIDPPAVSYPAASNADAVGGRCLYGRNPRRVVARVAPVRTVELANHLGAFVASQPGATPLLPREIISLVERA